MEVKSLTREDIAIDRELLVEDNGICAYIATWFDAYEKFSLDGADDDDISVNFYATFNPDANTLTCFYVVRDYINGDKEFPYIPTPEETELILSMMEETCLDEFDCDLRGLWDETKY